MPQCILGRCRYYAWRRQTFIVQLKARTVRGGALEIDQARKKSSVSDFVVVPGIRGKEGDISLEWLPRYPFWFGVDVLTQAYGAPQAGGDANADKTWQPTFTLYIGSRIEAVTGVSCVRGATRGLRVLSSTDDVFKAYGDAAAVVCVQVT